MFTITKTTIVVFVVGLLLGAGISNTSFGGQCIDAIIKLIRASVVSLTCPKGQGLTHPDSLNLLPTKERNMNSNLDGKYVDLIDSGAVKTGKMVFIPDFGNDCQNHVEKCIDCPHSQSCIYKIAARLSMNHSMVDRAMRI